MGSDVSISFGFGSWIVFPIALGIVAVTLPGARPKAFKGALLVAAGLTGGYVIIEWLVYSLLVPLGRVAEILFHSQSVALDIGWPSSAIVAFGTLVGVLSFPVGIATNAIMVAIRLTRTWDMDLWNFWHIAFIGVVVTIATDNIVEAIIAEAGVMAMVLMLADICQPSVKKHFGYDNLSFPTLVSLPYFVLAVGLKMVVFKSQILANKLVAVNKFIKERGQIFSPGNFAVIAFVVILAIGLVSHAGERSVFIGVVGATSTIILPRIVALVVEGLHPVAEMISSIMQGQVTKRGLFIGMDTALLVGDSVNVHASSVLVPVTVAMSIVLPGNHTLPLFDLPTIPFIIALMVPVFEGNLFFTIIGGVIAMVPTLYISTVMANVFSSATRLVGLTLPHGSVKVTSLVDGGNPIVLAVNGLAHLRWGMFIGIFMGALILLALVRRVVIRREFGSETPTATLVE